MRGLRAWGALGAVVLAAGCGYSFSGSSIPSYLHTIAIPSFSNDSLDPTIADQVTRGVSDRFLEDNRLKVAREGTADCLLEGRVTSYERKVYGYTPDQNPATYIVVIRVAIVLKDRVKNRDIWSTDRLEATSTYPASGAATATGLPGNEDEARIAAIQTLAQDILARSLERW
jgi:hypothetical protein